MKEKRSKTMLFLKVAIAISIQLVLLNKVDANPSAEKNHSVAKTETYQFVGNTFSHKFHKPSCEFARKIRMHNVILLRRKEIASAKKYKPCNWCFPAWTKTVSSKILDHSKSNRLNSSEKQKELKKQR